MSKIILGSRGKYFRGAGKIRALFSGSTDPPPLQGEGVAVIILRMKKTTWQRVNKNSSINASYDCKPN